MKKTSFLMKKVSFLWLLASAFLIIGCAEGYESPNGFDSGVHNQQLANPDSASFVVSTDGTSAKISWPLVYGASNYEVTFINVDDPANPQVVADFDKKLIDGSSVTVPVTEDSKYTFDIRVIGNADNGNKDAPDIKTFEFTTLVPSVATIPSGSDIAEVWKTIEPQIPVTTEEVAIDLEANGEYTISDTLDFGGHKLTFRGDKIYRPIVRMVGKGTICSYSGLKVKYINFDCAESTANSVVGMSVNNLPDEILSENLGYYRKNVGTITGIYIVQDPLYISHCWFKDIYRGLLYDNGVTCAYWYLVIDDCICQMRNTSNIGFICMQSKGRLIKNVSLINSTIYNIEDNGSAYFLRYSNSSNANPEKVFGNLTPDMYSQTFTISRCTLSKCFTKQKFVNNLSAVGQRLTIDHSIFYDINSVRQLPRWGGNKTFRFNFWWGITQIDTQDMQQKDDSGTPFAMDYDPQFQGDVLQSLDLTKPNGGVNFTPGEYQIIANEGGDPRWLQ